MPELTLKILVGGEKPILVEPVMHEPVEYLYRNPVRLREASPFALAQLKKELRTFDSRKMQWSKKDRIACSPAT
jgi:hypothetical protein